MGLLDQLGLPPEARDYGAVVDTQPAEIMIDERKGGGFDLRGILPSVEDVVLGAVGVYSTDGGRRVDVPVKGKHVFGVVDPYIEESTWGHLTRTLYGGISSGRGVTISDVVRLHDGLNRKTVVPVGSFAMRYLFSPQKTRLGYEVVFFEDMMLEESGDVVSGMIIHHGLRNTIPEMMDEQEFREIVRRALRKRALYDDESGSAYHSSDDDYVVVYGESVETERISGEHPVLVGLAGGMYDSARFSNSIPRVFGKYGLDVELEDGERVRRKGGFARRYVSINRSPYRSNRLVVSLTDSAHINTRHLSIVE